MLKRCKSGRQSEVDERRFKAGESVVRREPMKGECAGRSEVDERRARAFYIKTKKPEPFAERSIQACFGGKDGIRTHVPETGQPHFECGSL